jgi:uncharacterized protein DUF5999
LTPKEVHRRVPHDPRCPDASAPDRFAAHGLAGHPEQGWTLLCNGVVVFDDLGALLPTALTATSVPPPRPSPRLRAVRAFPARPATAAPSASALPAAA